MKRNNFLKALVSAGALGLIPKFTKATSKTLSNLLSPKIVKASEGSKVNVLGDNMTFKLTGKDTNGQMTMIIEENEPGTGIPPHVHTKEDEIFKVVEGSMELTVGDKTTILNAGDLAFGPRGVPHSWKIIGDKKAKVILSIFPSGLEDMFTEIGNLPPGPPDFPKVFEICGRYGITFLNKD